MLNSKHTKPKLPNKYTAQFNNTLKKTHTYYVTTYHNKQMKFTQKFRNNSNIKTRKTNRIEEQCKYIPPYFDKHKTKIA